jgi:hypothetical protein
MIPLITVESDSDITEYESKGNGKLIRKHFKKGYLWMLWKEKCKKGEQHLCIFEKVGWKRYVALEYYLGSDKSIPFKDNEGMNYEDMNIAGFECFLLTKKEAEPYLKEILVKSLNYHD